MKNIYGILLFATVGITSFSTLSADGNVTVTAEFFDATCNLHADSHNMTVALDNVQLSELKTPGAISKAVPFNLKFTDCALSTIAWVGFDGTAAENSSTVFALDEPGQSSTASGVGLEIIDDYRGEVMPVGYAPSGRLTTGLALVGKETTFPYSARYKSLSNDVKPGNANVTVQFNVRYD
ncbi:fimbrial protein [Serratia oryzae]|uniref:Fimbrial-type adhesion domain-containing protein n=1 Tax=Serratia oryzae TaxID=2034155 RepID=A0A1S8CG92_9GAMM|nr:fimbrial protein [Serratia oryzae]OMQ21035.1 hypothetical protein BMI79_15790 [Serratia oryzae]VXD08294.1 conserved exported hypothetical protein [Enterobacterales bacterium 8AC]